MRIISIVIALLFLVGCSASESSLDRAILLRNSMSSCSQYTFDAHITANYGDVVGKYSISCAGDSAGNIQFTVLSPESIEGISGQIKSNEGSIQFDDVVLAFPLLAEGEVSPVSAPWLLCKTLLSGYISSCCVEDQQLRITLNDTFEEDAMTVDVWLNENDLPSQAQIIWQGRSILSLKLENFRFV